MCVYIYIYGTSQEFVYAGGTVVLNPCWVEYGRSLIALLVSGLFIGMFSFTYLHL